MRLTSGYLLTSRLWVRPLNDADEEPTNFTLLIGEQPEQT